jgi:ferredoxin--NADP+ reductase
LAELEDKSNFTAAKNVEILQSWVANRVMAIDKRIVFHFLESPMHLAGNGRLERITLERNRLSGPPFGQSAHRTGDCVALRCGLLFRSIGYRGRPLPGVPFDESKGIFPNDAGRVGETPGLYAAGWIKRGPSGIIGTNRADAVATVQTLLADLVHLGPDPKPGAQGLCAALDCSGARVVGYADWLRIDAEEQRRGAVKDKPREKITRVSEMVAVLGSQTDVAV